MASSSYETVNYWNMIPPGFRFDPKDEELIAHYLVKKINGKALPPNKMHEAELYGVLAPQDLTLYYEAESDNTWYFFTRLERLYENGSRPRRSAGNGYWKATGVDAKIRNEQGIVIGYRKALAFFIKIEPPPKNKNEPKGIKTPWLMHEFRLANHPSTSEPKPKRHKTNDHDTAHFNTTPHQSQGSKPKNMLDGWVLCKVYKLGRDVAVEPPILVAQDQVVHAQEEHNQVVHAQEEEQHQAIEQPVALYNVANDHLLIPAIEDGFEHLQRNYQEEQHLHQEEEQHQNVALNNGANDHLVIPEIEDLFEHQQHVALNNGANDHLVIPETEDLFEHLQRNHQEEQQLHQEEKHQAIEQPIALNNGDNHHLLIPEIEDSFEHLQRNQALPQFSPEELEFLSIPFFNKC